MKHKALLLLFTVTFILSVHVSAQNSAQVSAQVSVQEIVFSPNDWQDPAIFEKGQVSPRAFHIPYDDEHEVLSVDQVPSPWLRSLNGAWAFAWFPSPGEVPVDFSDPGFDAGSWNTIPVPSNWQVEGYGHPKFRNIALTFLAEPPRVPVEDNPTGCYKRSFTVPPDWEGRRIFLRFEGIKSASYVWVNGKPAGYNQGGFEPAEYDITGLVQQGENDLSVKVLRFCDGSYLENQDMWRLSGIFRDVLLYAQPEVRIHDFYHTTDLDDEYRDAVLHVQADIRNDGAIAVEGYRMEVDVLDESGRSVLMETAVSKPLQLTGGAAEQVLLEIPVQEPRKWSAEYPDLYTILYVLKDSEGTVRETFSKNLGFKEVEMIDNRLTVNGVPVTLNGVNSHMHHPLHGQAVPEATLLKDLLLMKQFNINCVRTSHYPPSPVYLDMADRIGIYVVDEVGDEAHANIHLSEDSSFTEMYRDRTRKLVYRDRNHVSVLMWSAGNESGSGFNIGEVIATGLAIDPSRPAWMYGGNTFYIPYEHIVGPRYWIPYQLENLARGRVLPEDDLRPSFMDEYLAATGNGLGGMDEYWQMIRKYPRLMGGAIWDWISPGIRTPLWLTPDASGNGNKGYIMGRPQFAEGSSGRGIRFTGHDDWVECYQDPSLDITGKEITLSFMIRPEDRLPSQAILTKGSHHYGIVMPDPETLTFYLQTNNVETVYHTAYYSPESAQQQVSAEVPADWYGEWHHVAGVCNGKEMVLYIDGRVVARAPFSANISNSPYPFCIGRNAEEHDQGEFSGRLSSMTIDEVRVYNRAVPPGEPGPREHDSALVLHMSFEEDREAGAFYAVGLGGRTYGLVWPDRRVQPELHQVKKSGQPVEVTWPDTMQNAFRITNHYHFRNLDETELRWSVHRDGKLAESGVTEISLPAGESGLFDIPFVTSGGTGEQVLTLSFCLKEGTEWASAGHEVAWEQFSLTSRPMKSTEVTGGSVKAEWEADMLVVSGGEFRYVFDGASGLLKDCEFAGREYLHRAPLFNTWRAPLANDTDPWGGMNYTRSNQVPGMGRSIDNHVRWLGMQYLVPELDEMVVEKRSGEKVVVKIRRIWHASNYRGAFDCHEAWHIFPDGRMQVEFEVIPRGAMPEMLPRMGWQFYMPKRFEHLTWYGRGPFETYPDRKSGAKIGLYHSTVGGAYVPYLIPQDHGNHTDVRTLRVSDDNGNGWLIRSNELFQFSYQQYDTDNLTRARYTPQLIEASYHTLNLDVKVSGVGGTAVRQLAPYRVRPERTVAMFEIIPVRGDRQAGAEN